MSEILFWTKLQSRLHQMVDDVEGVVGVAVRDLKTAKQILINESIEFSTASTIKIPVLATLMAQAEKGAIDLATPVRVNQEALTAGSGVLQHFRYPATISVHDLAVMMIALSDNTATNMLIDLVSMPEVNSLLSAHCFVKTRLRRKMIDSVAASTGHENTGTPLELVRFLTLLYNGEIVSPQVSKNTIELLKVPKQGAMNQGLQETGVVMANKPGGMEGVTVDAGIVFLPRRPFAMCVMANYTLESRVTEEVGEMFKLVYDYENTLAYSTRFGRRLPLDDLRTDS